MRPDDASVLRASLDVPDRFEDIFDRHHTRIWRFLHRLGGAGCADDLASEVFVVAFARRASFDPQRGTVASWLYGIAANLARTRARGLARRERAVGRLQSRYEATTHVVDTLSARQEVGETVLAMAELSDAHREVLVLFAWEELGYDAIAEVLGVEVGTVRSRLARARGHLRELVERRGQVPGDDDATRRPSVG